MKNIEFYYGELIMNITTVEDIEKFNEKHNVEHHCKHPIVNLLMWLNNEHQTLSKEEKRYLRTVIKPFRKRIETIEKAGLDAGETEFIIINMKFDEDKLLSESMFFPRFDKGSMYKGMKTGKKYKLEELGL